MADITHTGGASANGQFSIPASEDVAGYPAPRHAAPGPNAAEQVPGPGYGPPVKTPEQLAYERGQRDAVRRLTTPRMTGFRVVCGICWAFWTVLFGVAALVGVSQGSVGTFLIAGILAGLSGWYDYRIWALKARRLTLFIIF